MTQTIEAPAPRTPGAEAPPVRQRWAVSGWDSNDIGLLILRVGIGTIFFGQSLQKLGWFKGDGYPTSISTQKAFLANFGCSSTGLLTWVLTLAELVAGLSILLGAITPIGAASAIGITFQFVGGLQWSGGLFGNQSAGGFEFSLPMFVAVIALAFTGPGRASIDHILGWRLSGWRWALVAIGAAVIVGGFVMIAFGSGLGGHPPIPAPPSGG